MRIILLSAVLILPPALLTANFAGGFWYIKEHTLYEQGHHHLSDARYFPLLREYEVVGAIIGGLPGLAIVLATSRRAAATRRKG